LGKSVATTKRELRGVFRNFASYALDVRGAAHGIWRFRAGRSEAMRAEANLTIDDIMPREAAVLSKSQ